MTDDNNVNETRLKIMKYIKLYIKKNHLSEGDRLPSQNTLAAQFHTDRNVIRSVFTQLAAQGIIYTEKGRGAFVASKNRPILFEHDNGMGFSEIMNSGTRDYVSNLISHTTISAGSYLSRMLEIEETDLVHSLLVVRSTDGIPFAICQSFLPEKHVPDFEKHLENFFSVNHILMEGYGYSHPVCSQVTITACAPTPDDIKYLHIPSQVPILKQNEVFYTDETGPIEYFIVRARGDKFHFKMKFSENT